MIEIIVMRLTIVLILIAIYIALPLTIMLGEILIKTFIYVLKSSTDHYKELINRIRKGK